MRRLALILLLGAVLTGPGPRPVHAEEGQEVEGSGYTLFGTESIKGSDEAKVAKDPVCDKNRRPKIKKVQPDEVKAGEKITIQGENFGTKECIYEVSFSSAPGTKVEYRYINDSALEATVPNGKTGMTFVIIVAGGGSAQKPVLIKGN